MYTSYVLTPINIRDNNLSIFFNMFVLSFVNVGLFYFIMHKLIFFKYVNIYNLLLGYQYVDQQYIYLRIRQYPRFILSLFLFIDDREYSHFKWMNILYFLCVFVVYLFICITIHDLIIVLLFMNFFFILVIIESLDSASRLDHLMILFKRNIEYAHQLAIPPRNETVDRRLKQLIIEIMRFPRIMFDIADDIIGHLIYLIFMELIILLLWLSLQSMKINLFLFMNDDGALTSYDFIPNLYHKSLLNKHGSIKLLIKIDVKLKSCIEMPKKGICIEFTVIKINNHKYNINYVVFENGEQVKDKFNLKRHKLK